MPICTDAERRLSVSCSLMIKRRAYCRRCVRSDARAFSSEVETGSRQDNASNQKSRPPFRFYRNGNGSRCAHAYNTRTHREQDFNLATLEYACALLGGCGASQYVEQTTLSVSAKAYLSRNVIVIAHRPSALKGVDQAAPTPSQDGSRTFRQDHRADPGCSGSASR